MTRINQYIDNKAPLGSFPMGGEGLVLYSWFER